MGIEIQDEKLKKTIDNILKVLPNIRKVQEFRWYKIDNFYEGNHFFEVLDPRTKEIKKDEFLNQVKEVAIVQRAKKQLVNAVNLIKANKPSWAVYPRKDIDLPKEVAEVFDKFALKISEFLEDIYYYNDIDDISTNVIEDGFKYGVGYAEVGIDENNNLFVSHFSPYQIYHDPSLTDLDQAKWLVKEVVKTKEEILNATRNVIDELTGEIKEIPLYDLEEAEKLKPESKVSLSTYYDLLERRFRRGVGDVFDDEILGRIIMHEIWVKYRGKFWIITEAQGKILRVEETPYTFLPFIAYVPIGQKLYQNTSWFEELIPLNKTLDVLITILNLLAKLGSKIILLKHKNTNIDELTSRVAELVEWEGQLPPEFMTPPSPSPILISAIEQVKLLMNELGLAMLTFGAVPRGVKAYKAIESLKSSEYSNLATPISRFEEFLEKMAEKILDILDLYLVEPTNFYLKGKNEVVNLVSLDYFLQNREFIQEYLKDGYIPISSKYLVRVEITTGLAYTEEGKRETILELAKAGLIPPSKVLEVFRFSNAKELIEETIKEKQWIEQLVKSQFETQENQQLDETTQ